MIRQLIESDNIKSIGYHEQTQTLGLEFLNERVYHYKDIEKIHFKNLLQHKNAGAYWATNIKGRYSYYRI